MFKLSVEQTEQFLDKIAVNLMGCWEWQRSTTSYGYGQIMFDGVPYYAHRLMYEINNFVTLKREHRICHTCDNPKCCRPDHLFLGNGQSNMDDKYFKGRGKTLFTAAQIEEIKKAYAELKSQRKVASLFEVAKGTVASVINGTYCPKFGPKA